MKKLLVTLVCMVFVFSFSCKKSNEDDNLKSGISIEDVKNSGLEYDKMVILVSSKGQKKPKEMTKQQVEREKYKTGSKVTVGVALYKGNDMIAGSKDGNSGCPFVIKKLLRGKNKFRLSTCKLFDKECTVVSHKDSSDSFYSKAIGELSSKCSNSYSEVSCLINNERTIYLSCKIDKKEGTIIPNAQFETDHINLENNSSVAAIEIGKEQTL